MSKSSLAIKKKTAKQNDKSIKSVNEFQQVDKNQYKVIKPLTRWQQESQRC